MRRRVALLAVASLVYSSPTSFSVNDDLLAFPQYEIIFSDSHISDVDASAHLAAAALTLSSPSLLLESSASSDSPPSSISPSTSSSSTASLASSTSTAGLSFLSSDRRSEISPASSGDSFQYMVLDSRPYLCTIPIAAQADLSRGANKTSKSEEERELARAADRGVTLLQELEGQCLYFVSGWWAYALCYGADIKQFHALPPGYNGAPPFPPVADPNTPMFVLGRFRKEKVEGKDRGQQQIGNKAQDAAAISDSTSSPKVSKSTTQLAHIHNKGDTRYMVQKLRGGTVCDITGRRRRIDVQFHCHPHSPDRIGWIKETATCSYLMAVYTPRLCSDVAFLPPRDAHPHPIRCHPIAAAADMAKLEGEKRTEQAAETRAVRPPLVALEPAAESKQQQQGPGNQAPELQRDFEFPPKANQLQDAQPNQPPESLHQAQPAESKPKSPPPILIGDIEVGAMRLVGRSRIEAPRGGPAGLEFGTLGVPGGTTEVVAVATATDTDEGRDGHNGQGAGVRRMSDEQLRQRDLDPRTVEELRRDLQEMAHGKAWKLEVVEAPDGTRELRGVVDDGDEDDEHGGEIEETGTSEDNGEEGRGVRWGGRKAWADERDGRLEEWADGDDGWDGDGDGDGMGSEEIYRDEL